MMPKPQPRSPRVDVSPVRAPPIPTVAIAICDDRGILLPHNANPRLRLVTYP